MAGWGEPYGRRTNAGVQPNQFVVRDFFGNPLPPFPTTVASSAICPDLLDHSQLGEADNLRGRVVRAFFWLMRLWPS